MSINSVRVLIKSLGGPALVARRCGVSMSAVTNWGARDAIPGRHQISVWQMTRERGVDWTPPGAEGLAPEPRQAA